MARYRRPVCQYLVGILLLICTTTALKCPDKVGTPGREIICYSKSRDLKKLENSLCSCTTLVQQGHDLQNLDASDWKDLQAEAKEANPDIKIVLSISDNHEVLKSSATTRQEATTHLIEIIKEVDGVELNVTAGSKDRLISFIKSLKDELVNKSLERMILLALPTKPEDLAKQFELKELSKYVDLFTIATHYLRDNDETHLTFHPSRLMGLFDMSNTDSLVDLISGMGAPKQKILISVPTNAYKFTLKKAEDNTPRSATVEEKPTALDRQQLCSMINDGEWTVERDEDLTAPYAFKNTSWIAFEDETSLKIKGKYVILRELAGIALRNIENDLKNDCGMSPAKAVSRAFADMNRKTREVVLSSLEKDLKSTEIAYPRHVRSSDFRIVRVIDTEGKIRAVRENTQTAFACSRQGYFVHPKSCNRFYRCVKFNQEIDDYSVFEFDCPAGLAFDERTEVCVWPGSISEGSACPGSSEIEPVPRNRFRCPGHAGFYADPQNCRWFFACYDLGGPEMVPFEFRCPFGLVFDEQRLMCEWPWKVPNCNGPGHGGEHSVYHYGGSYSGQGDFVQGGIIGQGGFIGPIGYDGQNFGVEGSYNGQIYNAAEAGAGYNGQAYNADGAGAGFAGQTYNNAEAYGVGAGYDGQTYNVAGAGFGGQTYKGAGSGGQYDEQTYYPGGAGRYNGQSHTGGADGQTYNAVGASGTGLGPNKQTYDGQEGNFGIGTDGEYRPVYASDANIGSNYDGQTYNAGAQAGWSAVQGVNYNGHNFNNAGSPGFAANPGYNYNAPGARYPGPVYNKPDEDCNDQNYKTNDGVGNVDINNRFNGPDVNTASVDNSKGINVDSSDYDDQRGTTGTSAFNAQTTLNAESGNRNTQFNSANAQTTLNINNFAGDTRLPTAFTTGPVNYGRDSVSTVGITAGETSGYNAGATNQHTVGFTTGYADNLATQNTLITNNERFGTGFPGATSDFKNTQYTKTPHAQNTNFNTFNTKSQTDYFNNNANTDISTIGYTNSIEHQNSIGYPETGRSTVYNSSHSANAGYPSSTIIPFVNRHSTIGPDNTGTTPFNSMGLSTEHFGSNQYTNQAEKSFTQQRENINGFTFNGRTQNTQNFNTVTNNYDDSRINSAGVTTSFNQGGQLDNRGQVAGNVIASAGTLNFHASTQNNYNTNTDITNTYGNSDIIGSSISSANNDIIGFHGSTETPNNYQTNENTIASTAFRTGNNVYNQGTVTNQNSLISNTFSRTNILNPVTTAGLIKNFNRQGTQVPGVAPGIIINNNIRPAVELDNSGVFGTNGFAGSTTSARPINIPSTTTLTPQQNTYRTNEYYDNGGRGTIRYNNGVITNKATANDIQDYRTSSYTGIPSSFIINSGNDDNSQSTIQQFDSTNTQQVDQGTYTKEGFTKTGPTKTGITTAQVGGSGSYVIGTGVPRAKPNPQLIGENAFAGSFGTTGGQRDFEGTTNFNSRGSVTNFNQAGLTNFNAKSNTNLNTAGTTGFRGNVNNFGTTNFNAQHGTNFGETATTAEFGTSQLSNNINTASGRTDNQGYSYPKPLIQLEIKANPTTPGVPRTNFLDNTTPTSNLNDQSYTNQNTLISNIQNNGGGFSTTISPIGFTTNQLENFRTTVYQAVKVPQAISTVQPVLDNGFRTVISSTPVPILISTPRGTYQPDDFVTGPKTYLDVGISFEGNDYQVGNTDYNDYTASLDQGNFGQRVTGPLGTKFTDTNQNSELITPTQFYAGQTNIGVTGQTGTYRANQANNFRNGITSVPTPVYVSSSTVAPAIGVTFTKPIVAAEISQHGQFDGLSTISNSINRNSAGFTSQSSANRILNNQVSANVTPQNRILINEVSADLGSSQLSNTQGLSNGVVKNQASAIFTSQSANKEFVNNQASNFALRGSSNRLLNNHASNDFTSKGVSNGQVSLNTFSNQNQGANGHTRTLIGSSVITSSVGGADFNNDIIRENVELNKNLARLQQITTTKPEVTTYLGPFTRTRSRIKSNSFDSQNEKRKVIVKLSDLHPLILGKLGAECTCKADPFAVFRGPKRQNMPVYSQNRGQVDLANYDESDIYVDVDSEKENEKEIELLRNIPSNRLIKTSDSRFNDALDNRGITVTSRGDPIFSSRIPPTSVRPSSTTYLPPVRISTTTYLPPTSDSNEYLPPANEEELAPVYRENQAQGQLTRSQNRQPLLIKVEDNSNAQLPQRQLRGRVGKALFDGPARSANDLRDAGASFDRYGPGGLRSNDETLQGELDCARPGLFRHPKFCNKFYACHWDSWKKRYTLHIFNCPVHLAFDSSAGACNYPTKGPACQDNKLLI